MDSVGPALTAAVEALRELILAGENYRQATSGYLGLDTSQTQAVSYLYGRGEMGQSELGALLGYNTSSMTALVDRLERDGIATRVPHPTDRRRLTVRLTDEGRAAVRSTGRWFIGAFDHVEHSSLPAVTAALTFIAEDLRVNARDIAAHNTPRRGEADPPLLGEERSADVLRAAVSPKASSQNPQRRRYSPTELRDRPLT